MASFNLQWRSSTKKDLRKLPSREVERILAEVEPLADEPFPAWDCTFVPCSYG